MASKIANLVDWVIFVVLLSITVVFVLQVYQEYLQEETYFIQSLQEVTESDIPTITFCIKARKQLVYGKDFEIELGSEHDKSSFINLTQGINKIFIESKSGKGTERRVTLQQLLQIDHPLGVDALKLACVSIDQRFESDLSHLGMNLIGYDFKHKKKNLKI